MILSLNHHHELNVFNGYSWPMFNTSLHVCHNAFIAIYPNVSMLAVVGILPSVFRFEEPLVMSIDKETRQISPPRGSSLIALQGSYPCQSPQDWISLSLSLSPSLSGSIPLAGRGLSMSLL